MEMNDEKILRILGKRGRVTIPQEVRDAIGMARGDVVSFAVVSEDCALVKRERICDGNSLTLSTTEAIGSPFHYSFSCGSPCYAIARAIFRVIFTAVLVA